MKAVILSVGDELLTGSIVDTNSAWLSSRLMELGIPVLRHVTVGDELDSIAAALAEAARQAELVLVTGGLGPTLDDLSRQGLAQAMGAPLRLDEASLRRIEAFFSARARPMSDSNRSQAMLPEGAEPLDNDCGTAPGIFARLGGAMVFVMPGVPHEMTEMYGKQVLPRLACPPQAAPNGAVGRAGRCIVQKVLRTFGAGESVIGEQIADLMRRGRNPAVGTTASASIISVRIVAHGATSAEARSAAEADAAEVRRRLGELFFGEDDQTLAEAVGAALKAAGATLATAESCTGGMIGQMITAVSGSSAYYLGGVVSYADAAKTELLGVAPELFRQHGAVSEPVAAAMAEGVRRRLAADWGLSVTGIAGPTGGTAAKPVGLVYIGLASAGGCQVYRSLFPSHRELVRARSSLMALNYLRLGLRHQ